MGVSVYSEDALTPCILFTSPFHEVVTGENATKHFFFFWIIPKKRYVLRIPALVGRSTLSPYQQAVKLVIVSFLSVATLFYT